MGRTGIIGQHLALTGSLFWRYGAVLTAVWAGGMLLNQILLRIAVEIGLWNRLFGLVTLALVVMLQLLVFVAMFVILRRGLPRLRLRRRVTQHPDPIADLSDRAPQGEVQARGFALTLLAVLIPFYGYYAGWGFLANTLRSYTQIFYTTQLARMDYGNPGRLQVALEIDETSWVVVTVAVIWLIRRGAKAMSARAGASGLWPMLIVTCEATWALLGLYVLSGWKSEFAAWLATLPSPQMLLESVFGPAEAAITDAARLPVDWPLPFQLWPFLTALFWFALLPLVWFNLGAIVYGHDLTSMKEPTRRLAGHALDQWRALPKPLTDFIGHFWAGVIKRWHAVTNGVLLAASAGVVLTCSVLVLWRLVDWLGAWAWVGASELIGPQDMQSWAVLGVPLNVLFGTPGAQTNGLLVCPLQFCILAAGLELAGRAQEAAAKARPEAAAAA